MNQFNSSTSSFYNKYKKYFVLEIIEDILEDTDKEEYDD